MNKELSIGTDIAPKPEVALNAPTDTDGSVPVDIRHLSADPENIAQFQEQLHSKSQSKGTKNISTAEGETKHDISESPVLKHSAPNERTFFGNNDRHSPPFVAAQSPHPSQSQNTDGSLKDFYEKSMGFDVSSQSSALKTGGGAATRSSEISKSLSKTDHTASTSQRPSETQTRKQPRSLENTSDAHKTAVLETIPFLRTSNETVATVQEPTAAQASKSHATLIAQQIRDHIIDRILVSSSALNDNRTVTVQLSPRLLRDTEVQFTQNDTSLDIRLISQNKDSVQFLQQHQSDLRTYLQGELKTYRAISVRVPSSQASAELSQPHDGRSRNRFDYQSADEEETT